MSIQSSHLTQSLRKIFYFGRQHKCPICMSSLRVLKPMNTTKKRMNALCPICSSLERHRLQWLYLKNKTNLFSGAKLRILHIAPESCFIDKLTQLKSLEYITADLFNPAMVQMDITDIEYQDNYFDVILCSHVLEHIEDDRKAMSELSRVLNHNGWAIIQVPILLENTFEDPNITSPAERALRFGQQDHVRIYGSDYKNRLEESNFAVTTIPYLETFTIQQKKMYGFSKDKDDIYLCHSLPNKM